MRHYQSILIAALLTGVATVAEAKGVLFSDAFRAGTLGGSTVVQVPRGSVLVFDGGDYVLDGRDIVITASQAVVRSPTTIRSYTPIDVPASATGTPAPVPQASGQLPCNGRNGCPGVGGASGAHGDDTADPKGQPSGKYVLQISNLSSVGNAVLTIIGSGQKGGRGQQGGQGGQGAIGDTGANATGLPSCETPGQGGPGGPGGAPGRGGMGGTGGKGADVLVTPQIIALAANKSIVQIDLAGGSGGDPGPPGAQGIGGQGGARGAGSRSCHHTPPDPASDGPLGPIDPPADQIVPGSHNGDSGFLRPIAN